VYPNGSCQSKNVNKEKGQNHQQRCKRPNQSNTKYPVNYHDKTYTKPGSKNITNEHSAIVKTWLRPIVLPTMAAGLGHFKWFLKRKGWRIK
jgi:hypothetical protein